MENNKMTDHFFVILFCLDLSVCHRTGLSEQDAYMC